MAEWPARWAATAKVAVTALGPGAVRLTGRGPAGRWSSEACNLGHGIIAGIAEIDTVSEVLVRTGGSDLLTIHIIVSGQATFGDGRAGAPPCTVQAGQALLRIGAPQSPSVARLPAKRQMRLLQIACDQDRLAEDFRIVGGAAALRTACASLQPVKLTGPARRLLHGLVALDLRRPLGLARFEAGVLELLCILLEPLLAPQPPIEPAQTSDSALRQLHDARALLDLHFDAPPTIAALAAKVAINQSKLMRGFKALFGVTIAGYTLRLRMERARQLLLAEGLGVAQSGYQVGYQHHSSFTAAFTQYFGITPSTMLEQTRRDSPTPP